MNIRQKHDEIRVEAEVSGIKFELLDVSTYRWYRIDIIRAFELIDEVWGDNGREVIKSLHSNEIAETSKGYIRIAPKAH